MFSNYGYNFYQLDRVGDDSVTETQNDLQNSRYANYNTANFFSEFPSDAQIQFATKQPIVTPNSVSFGSGVGVNVDVDSKLIIQNEQERNLGRLSLIERPFATVPYLGRGSVDPNLESQLLQGEPIADKKSVTTIMSKSFLGYTMYPADSKMVDDATNPKNTIEDSALRGWVRGGADTRNKGVTN